MKPPLTKNQADEIHREYTRCQVMSGEYTTLMFYSWLKENTGDSWISVEDEIQSKIDKALERGKEIGIAVSSAPCLFCRKKSNECECGHKEIAKRMIEKFTEEKQLDHPVAIALLASILHWLDKEGE